jgi:hypothetical protein
MPEFGDVLNASHTPHHKVALFVTGAPEVKIKNPSNEEIS